MPRLTRALVPALLVLTVAGCKDATLGPEDRGDIDGQVLDYETGEPVAGAGITTTPPSQALVTDSLGRFLIEDLAAGNYQVSARKSGYRPNTVGVAVEDEHAATAVIFLETEAGDGDGGPALEVEINSFWNTTAGDSTFVEAEYRVRNAGDASAPSYEVYFRIETTGDTYYHEEQGQGLGVGQADVKRFTAYIQQDSATSVTVTDTWVEGSG